MIVVVTVDMILVYVIDVVSIGHVAVRGNVAMVVVGGAVADAAPVVVATPCCRSCDCVRRCCCCCRN